MPEWEGNESHLRALAAEVQALYPAYLGGLAAVSGAGPVSSGPRFPPNNPTALAYRVAATLPIGLVEKQWLLELGFTAGRLAAEVGLLRRERALADRPGPVGGTTGLATLARGFPDGTTKSSRRPE